MNVYTYILYMVAVQLETMQSWLYFESIMKWRIILAEILGPCRKPQDSLINSTFNNISHLLGQAFCFMETT